MTQRCIAGEDPTASLSRRIALHSSQRGHDREHRLQYEGQLAASTVAVAQPSITGGCLTPCSKDESDESGHPFSSSLNDDWGNSYGFNPLWSFGGVASSCASVRTQQWQTDGRESKASRCGCRCHGHSCTDQARRTNLQPSRLPILSGHKQQEQQSVLPVGTLHHFLSLPPSSSCSAPTSIDRHSRLATASSHSALKVVCQFAAFVCFASIDSISSGRMPSQSFD